jgi:exodeoxyribonuclease-3
MRVISLSVDGIFQAAQRGLYKWLASQDADFICLQDLRALERELEKPEFQLEGYNAYFFDSGTKHYNGVAIYTRLQPKALIYGLGFASGVDMEGRYLQVDFEQLSIGSLLAPSATSEAESQEVKIKFFDDFQAHLDKLADGPHTERCEQQFCQST